MRIKNDEAIGDDSNDDFELSMHDLVQLSQLEQQHEEDQVCPFSMVALEEKLPDGHIFPAGAGLVIPRNEEESYYANSFWINPV